MPLIIHLASGEFLKRQLSGFISVALGLIVLVRVQLAPSEPRQSFEHLRRDAAFRPIVLDILFGVCEVPVGDSFSNVTDDLGRCGEAGNRK